MEIPQLTFTRFLASISIVILHFGFYTWPMDTTLVAPFRDNLITAMSYFFILSGFILVISISKNGSLPDKLNSIQFWKRRAARILPVYFLAMLIYFLLNFKYDPDLSIVWQLQPYAYSSLLIQAWNHELVMDVNFPSWSLSVEAFFYLLFPLLFSMIRKLRNNILLVIAGGAWILNLVVFVLLKDAGVPHNFLYYFPLLHLATFLTGMCLGVILIKNYNWLVTSGRKYIHSATIVVTIFVVYTSFMNYDFYEYQHNGMLAPFYILIIFSLSIMQGKLVKVLASKQLVFLGSISYAIYILQYPIYQFCEQYVPGMRELAAKDMFYSYVLILMLFSSLVYLFLEKPARRWFIERYHLKNTQKDLE